MYSKLQPVKKMVKRQTENGKLIGTFKMEVLPSKSEHDDDSIADVEKPARGSIRDMRRLAAARRKKDALKDGGNGVAASVDKVRVPSPTMIRVRPFTPHPSRNAPPKEKAVSRSRIPHPRKPQPAKNLGLQKNTPPATEICVKTEIPVSESQASDSGGADSTVGLLCVRRKSKQQKTRKERRAKSVKKKKEAESAVLKDVDETDLVGVDSSSESESHLRYLKEPVDDHQKSEARENVILDEKDLKPSRHPKKAARDGDTKKEIADVRRMKHGRRLAPLKKVPATAINLVGIPGFERPLHPFGVPDTDAERSRKNGGSSREESRKKNKHDAMEGSSHDNAGYAQPESKDIDAFRKLDRKKLSPNMLRPRAPRGMKRVIERVKSVICCIPPNRDPTTDRPAGPPSGTDAIADPYFVDVNAEVPWELQPRENRVSKAWVRASQVGARDRLREKRRRAKEVEKIKNILAKMAPGKGNIDSMKNELVEDDEEVDGDIPAHISDGVYGLPRSRLLPIHMDGRRLRRSVLEMCRMDRSPNQSTMDEWEDHKLLFRTDEPRPARPERPKAAKYPRTPQILPEGYEEKYLIAPRPPARQLQVTNDEMPSTSFHPHNDHRVQFTRDYDIPFSVRRLNEAIERRNQVHLHPNAGQVPRFLPRADLAAVHKYIQPTNHHTYDP